MRATAVIAAFALCTAVIPVRSQTVTFEKVDIEVTSPGAVPGAEPQGLKQDAATPAPVAEEKTAPVETAKKTLRIISDFKSPPLAFKEAGVLKGTEVELGEAIGKALGMEVQWIEKNFSIPAYVSMLERGEADAAMTSITITDERKRQVDFAGPYFKTGLAIAVNEDIDWKHNIFATGMENWHIGVMRDTTGEKWARENLQGEVKTFSSVERLVQELKNARLESKRGETGFCILHDQTILRWALAEYGYRFKIVETGIDPQSYGIAVRKGNSKLLADLNAALDRVRQSGEGRRIFKKWQAVAEEQDFPSQEE